MLPTIQTILSQVKDLLVTPADNTVMLGLTMHIPNNNSPGTPFTWANFYNNLSLSGLEDCTFFQTEIGTLDSNGSPLITNNQALMKAFWQYNLYGHNNLHP